VTLLPPLGTIGVRAAAGSADPFAIWVPTLVATTCSTLTAVAVYYLLRDLPRYRHRAPPTPAGDAAPDPLAEEVEIPEPRPWRPMGPRLGAFVLVCALALATALAVDAARVLGELGLGDGSLGLVRTWLFPLLLAGLLLAGVAGRVPVYESAIEGAREGLQVAARIVPYLVAILVAVAMFRASGALDLLIRVLDPLTSAIGFPAEALPMALLRPLSGSGAFAVMSETLKAHGPDSFVGLLTSTLQGSTETTFYVLALYLGAARVRDGRHALAACLVGDLAGFAGATAACHLFFG
jgi:spore maturation protein SpmB